jgi:hypothetical protein
MSARTVGTVRRWDFRDGRLTGDRPRKAAVRSAAVPQMVNLAGDNRDCWVRSVTASILNATQEQTYRPFAPIAGFLTLAGILRE